MIIYFYVSQYYINCTDWKYGLNNTYIENNIKKYGCKIKYPTTCPYKLGKYIFDYSKKSSGLCNDKSNTKKKLLINSDNKYINYKTKRFGYPLPNKNMKIHTSISINSNIIKNFFKHNLVDMDNQTLVNKMYNNNYPEIIIDYNKNPLGELLIDVQFNETLSMERKLLEKKTSPYSDNIIIIFIDSVSRAYSKRSLKKTLKFFENFMKYKGSYNRNFPSENFHSFQFFKYHSFDHYTRFNYPPIFYGKTFGNLVRNTKYLKENGYVTCYVNDMCLQEPTNLGHTMLANEISDHEMLICDPNMRHIFSTSIRCLYNKKTAYYAFEYGEKFWSKYIENRKYLHINLEDGHEGTLEVLKYSDDIIYNFLNKLYNKNLLKGTSVFLISDHGTTCPSPYIISEFYHIERYLPMLYIICNDRKNISYDNQYKNINRNQQILITGYDVYNTISNLVFGDKYYLVKNKTEENETPKTQLGNSLFSRIDPLKRIPKNYENMTNYICVE